MSQIEAQTEHTAPSSLAGESRGGGTVRRLAVWGPLSPLALAFAVFAFGLDQAHKWWMLNVLDIASQGRIRITGFFDLVLTWNRGISYGLFQQGTNLGQFLLVALSIATAVVLWGWAARSDRPLTSAALGLIIGGALGNGLDRLLHGAVADFFLFHAFGYSWYVFNLADTAIVVGAGLLILGGLRTPRSRTGQSAR